MGRAPIQRTDVESKGESLTREAQRTEKVGGEGEMERR